jgi:hypothetical protein
MATVPESPATTSARRSTDYWIFLSAAIIASIVLRLIVNTKFQAPTILTDELTYSQLARDIADGKFSLSNGYGVVYPLLLAPSWAFNTYGTEAYTWMKATNAVLVSLTAIPVFFWAKRILRPRYALLAAILVLAMPSMAYSGHVMTENAFLLFFVLAAWAIAVAVERPTILNQVLVVLAVAVAFGTRAQAVVLLAALPLIIVLHVLAEERASGGFSIRGCGRRFVRFWPLTAIAGLGVLAILVRTIATDWQVSQLLQAYSATTAGQYTVENVSRYFLWHLGEATFALGVIPVAALLLLVGMGILNRTRSSAERAYLCTALVVSPLVILQVAIFTSWFSQRVSERNMFCVFPIVLIGLALWFDKDMPRTRRVTAFAAGIAGVLVLSVPFGYLYQRAPSTETWAIVLPELLTRKLAQQGYDVQVVIVIGVALALALFGVTRRRLALVGIPIALVLVFAIHQAAVVHSVSKVARDYRAAAGTDPSWIDRTVAGNAPIGLVTGSELGPDAERVVIWETQFFNRHPLVAIDRGSLAVDPASGAIAVAGNAVLPEAVVSPTNFVFDAPIAAQQSGYVLQRLAPPYRLAFRTGGIYPDGWAGQNAAVDVFENGDSPVRVSTSRIAGPAGLPAGSLSVTSGTLAIGDDGNPHVGAPVATQTLPVPVDSSTTGDIAITSPARIEFVFDSGFSWADYGLPDARILGGRLSLTLGGISVP